MQNTRKRYLGKLTQKTLTVGANLGFSESVSNLSTLLESLGTDGMSPKVNRIKFFARARHESSLDHFMIQPMIVQTAGTFTDDASTALRIIDEMLASTIDDEFGYQNIGDPRVSKAPSGDEFQFCNVDFEIPKNIINLMNKQVNTERLQEILLGLCGNATTAGDIIIDYFYVIDYTLVGKGITIR